MHHMHIHAQMHNWWLMLVIMWTKNGGIATNAHANTQLMIKARWLMLRKICCVQLCMFAIFKESIIKELQHKVLWVHVGNQGCF